MFKTYSIFLQELDKELNKFFKNQKKNIKCKKNCSYCCEKGNYPFSLPEFQYLTEGYINLPPEQKKIVQKNIKNLLTEKKQSKEKIFEHQCPFLINKQCSVYKYRGIICRTFGLAYYDDEKNKVRIPDCVNIGLNYSEYYEKETKTLNLEKIIRKNLRTDKILQSDIAKKHKIEEIEIKPMLEWIEKI